MRFLDHTVLIAPLAAAAAVLAYPVYRARHWLATKTASPVAEVSTSVEMSMNDPQWGKRGGKNDGPPDLDEILRKFNQKLSSLFGQKNANNGGDGGGPSGPGAPSPAMMGGVFGIGLVLAALVWLASGFYIVQEGTRGI